MTVKVEARVRGEGAPAGGTDARGPAGSGDRRARGRRARPDGGQERERGLMAGRGRGH